MVFRHRYLIFLLMLLTATSLACSLFSSEEAPAETSPSSEAETPTAQLVVTMSPASESEGAEVSTTFARYEGDGMEIWLPDTYEGGDLDEDLDLILDGLNQLGSDFEQIAQMIEQNPSLFAFWAFDSKVGNTAFLTNANVTREEVVSAVDIETYMDLAFSQFPADFQIVEREMVTIDGQPVGRAILEFAVSNLAGKEILYIYKVGDNIWVITFATSAPEFDRRLPDFEESARTFAVQ